MLKQLGFSAQAHGCFMRLIILVLKAQVMNLFSSTLDIHQGHSVVNDLVSF